MIYIIVNFSEERKPEKDVDDSKDNQKDNEDDQLDSVSIAKLTIQTILESVDQRSKGLFKVDAS